MEKRNSWRQGRRIRRRISVYSIHARGQLFLFRSDFTLRPLSLLFLLPPLPHVYTNPGETPGDPILFRDRVGKRVWQTVSGKTLNARVSSYSRDTFSKSKRDEREKERENVYVCEYLESCKYLNVECSIPRGISFHTLVDRCRSGQRDVTS